MFLRFQISLQLSLKDRISLLAEIFQKVPLNRDFLIPFLVIPLSRNSIRVHSSVILDQRLDRLLESVLCNPMGPFVLSEVVSVNRPR